VLAPFSLVGIWRVASDRELIQNQRSPLLRFELQRSEWLSPLLPVRVMKRRRMTGRNGLLVWSGLAVAALVALSSGLALGGVRLVLALLQLAFILTIIVWLTRLRRGQVKVAEELEKISHLVEEIKREREAIPPRSTRRSHRGNGRQRSDRRW
jgi:hypothetical protein